MKQITLRTCFIATTLIQVLMGCATLTKEECLSGNWKGIGFTDGAQGYPIDRLGEHRKACADFGVTPNLATYQSGYQEGLKSYCVPATGFELGKQAKAYNGVCPDELKTPFIQQYIQGLQSAQKLTADKLQREEIQLDEQQKVMLYLDDQEEFKKMQTKLQSTHQSVKQLREKQIEIQQMIQQAQSML